MLDHADHLAALDVAHGHLGVRMLGLVRYVAASIAVAFTSR
jgi:hypothetical protein